MSIGGSEELQVGIPMKAVPTVRASQGPTVKSIPTRSLVGVVLPYLLAASLNGCTYVASDSFCRFEVQGTVQSVAGEPLADVSVRFLDTGLDQWRRSSYQPILIADTDSKGRVSAIFSYGWGSRQRTGKGMPREPGVFKLVFDSEGFETVEREFQMENLPARDNMKGCYLLLDFAVVMRAIPQSAPPFSARH